MWTGLHLVVATVVFFFFRWLFKLSKRHGKARAAFFTKLSKSCWFYDLTLAAGGVRLLLLTTHACSVQR